MDTAYVLHRRRYRESSLIVEFLTVGHGRLAAVAKGALRRRSELAGVLQPLTPLAIETRGRGELHTLVRAEATRSATVLDGRALYAVFYLNELVMRLTAAGDPLPALFRSYEHALGALAAGMALETCLRQFECGLLEAVGLGLHLEHEVEGGTPVMPDTEYVYAVESGPLRDVTSAHGCRVHGDTLLALATGGPFTASQAREAKLLLRHVLNHHLDGRPLASRELFAAQVAPGSAPGDAR